MPRRGVPACLERRFLDYLAHTYRPPVVLEATDILHFDATGDKIGRGRESRLPDKSDSYYSYCGLFLEIGDHLVYTVDTLERCSKTPTP
jgi:hypothetical protein